MAQTQRPTKKSAAKKAPAKKAAPRKASAEKAVAKATPARVITPPEPMPAAVAAAIAAPQPPETTAPKGRGGVISIVLAIVLALVGGAQLLKLSGQQWGGPPRMDVYLGDGVPGTLYLPAEELDRDEPLPEPKPIGERPPLIVMAHGYSSDQQGLSTMARSLALAGYATFTFDFRGHGGNRNRFAGNLNDDLTTVINWAVTSPYIDKDRIAVLGHSMGAGAANDFSTLDTRVAAMIPISGSSPPNDRHTPAHSLYIVASGDPKGIHNAMEQDSDALKAKDADVEYLEISGTDHLTVVSDGRTFDAISKFMDTALPGPKGEEQSTGRDDPRRATAIRYMFTVLALIALLGRAVGKAVRPLETRTQPGAWLLLVGAMLITMPLLAVQGLGILPVGAGSQVAVAFLLAAAVLWGIRRYVQLGVIGGRVADWVGDGEWLPLRSVAIPGVVAGLAMFVLIAPAGVILHATVPNVERTIYWILLTLAVLPFFAAFEAIVRRGGWVSGIVTGVLGRVLLQVTMLVGLGIGALPFVLSLILSTLILQYVVIEVFAAFAWAKGKNTAVIAVTEAIFISWVAVMFSPVF